VRGIQDAETKHGPVFVTALLVGLSHALVVSQKAASGNLPADASQNYGREDFLSYCAACHGVDGKGDGTVAEFLTITAADLTQLRKMNAGSFPRERIHNVIDGRAEVKIHGARDMPVWGDWFKFEADASVAGKGATEEVELERINTLINYIESIQEN
jgi:mono/diheme cytochrome c family protein